AAESAVARGAHHRAFHRAAFRAGAGIATERTRDGPIVGLCTFFVRRERSVLSVEAGTRDQAHTPEHDVIGACHECSNARLALHFGVRGSKGDVFDDDSVRLDAQREAGAGWAELSRAGCVVAPSHAIEAAAQGEILRSGSEIHALVVIRV